MVLPNYTGLILSVPAFGDKKKLCHGFSTRLGGASPAPFDSLNLGFHVGDDEKLVRKNRELFAQAAGFQSQNLVTLNQVHGAKVLVLKDGDSVQKKEPLEFDAMVTNQKGKVLAIQTADCFPILVYDAQREVIAAIHAGWRGLAKGVIEETFKILKNSFRSDASKVQVVIGPGIGECCFEVGEEVFQAFCQRDSVYKQFFTSKTPKEFFVDLRKVAGRILIQEGVTGTNIFLIPLCTCCRKDLFFSYRRDGERSGRHLNFIQLIP